MPAANDPSRIFQESFENPVTDLLWFATLARSSNKHKRSPTGNGPDER
jgi:hypothetical protein